MKKRIPSIKKCLISNSKSAILSAIEIHNKPLFSYRYEVCVLLVINAWELLLKAYIYKFMKHVRLFRKDGTTKPFDECLDCVASEIGKKFASSHQSISLLYKYRNLIAHFYSEEMDVIIFSLLKPNIVFYNRFIRQYFDIDLSKETGLILLPIGFSKLYSPIDFISNNSVISESPKILKDFIGDIINSTKKLVEQGIDEPIIVDFKINLINEKRIKNADLIAGINNQLSNNAIFTVTQKHSSIKLTDDPAAIAVRLSREKEGTQGTLIHEELSNQLFDEINNVVDINTLLTKDENNFVLGESIYYRIYAERDHVKYNVDIYYLLSKVALNEFYSPFLFWIIHLPAEKISQLIYCLLEDIHYPNILALIRLTTLLSENINEWLFKCFDSKWSKNTQFPNYYWKLKEIVTKSKNQNERCALALNLSLGNRISIPHVENGKSLQDLFNNNQLANQYLTQTCFLRFNGEKRYKQISRILDAICYCKQLEVLGASVEQEMKRSKKWNKMKIHVRSDVEIKKDENE
jgi:hypothetical protein